MLRVALGRARPDTEWSCKNSGLDFTSDHSSGTGAQTSIGRSRLHNSCICGGFRTDTTILTVPRSHLEYEIDLEVQGSVSDLNAATQGNLDTTLLSKEQVESA
jgi:hypothetical protein